MQTLIYQVTIFVNLLQNKNKSRTIHDLEGTMSKLLATDRRSQATGDVQVSIPLNDRDASRLTGTPTGHYSISRDECVKSTQTIETAFVPCEACDVVQRNLRDVGDAVVGICASQDLPSSLSKHRTNLGKVPKSLISTKRPDLDQNV